ncbi:MAG: S-layer homology domain-containing protein [Anaerotignum sp.]|nr:S-layer homology domain-containing protein [Anaerotignum sp.]
MKRKLTLFLSAVMATSCLPMTAYAANFKDINDVPWASGVINSVADKGLLSGYEDNTFRGKNNVTYCEAMQMVYSAMVKSGAAGDMDAVTVYSYMQSLGALDVPKWAQMAVAYGLSEGILDMQMVATKFAGNKAATREDVAIMFGNAMGKVYGKDRDTSDAKTFADHWNISGAALEQVSMLKKMGIIKGDDNRKFNPKQNINRAEMAVMLSNTYDVVTSGISDTAEVTAFEKNVGNDGTVYYYMEVKTAAGHKEVFHMKEGEVSVYAGGEKISLAELSKGDDISLKYSGTKLLSVELLKATTAQEKYDVTGYAQSVRSNILYVENENTGEVAGYKLGDNSVCYVEGEKISRFKLDDILKEHYADYIYAGVNTEVKREKISGEYQDVIYVSEVYLTFTKEYSATGEVKTYSATNITLKVAEDETKNFILADDCKLYIDDKESSYSDLKKLANSGTVFAKVKVNDKDRVTMVTMSETSFGKSAEQEDGKTYTVSSLTDKRLVLKDGSESITYTFGSSNPVDNIRFYTWDAYGEDWVAASAAEAKDYVDAETYLGKDGFSKTVNEIYGRVAFNSGGKLDEVRVSAVRSAWRTSDDTKTERKGDVEYIKDDVLKLKDSSIKYTLLKKYESGKLIINGAPTSSKTVLTRMANDDSIGLYAEIEANGDNEITKITARPTAAVGKLIDWDDSTKVIEIETKDGNTFKLTTQRKPKLTDEKEGVFELSDIAGPRYEGDWIELGFTTSGIVDTFTLVDGPRDLNMTDKLSGIATAAYDGLEIDGKTYPWFGKTGDIDVANVSCPQTSLSVIKDLIEDPDVEVYVDITLTDEGKVNGITAYVKEAVGELTGHGNTLKIVTEAGNRFSFYAKGKLEVDINGWNETDLEVFDRGIGEVVVLTFSDRGEVYKVEGK